MDNQPLTPPARPPVDRRVRAAKIKLWIGLGLIVFIGLAVAIYFVFVKEAAAPVVNTSAMNTNKDFDANIVANTEVDTPTNALDVLPPATRNADGDVYPSNGHGYVPDHWKTVVLDSDYNGEHSPQNNLHSEISETSDSLVNTFTEDRYYIERENDATYCGPNGGTEICNLIKEASDGSRETVADLWFPESTTTPDGQDYIFRKFGAQLVSFLDADTLQLYFAAGDHGGGYSEIANYSLSTKQLTPVLEYYQSEGMIQDTYTILKYSIVKHGHTLAFINGNVSLGTAFDGLDEGVFVTTDAAHVSRLHFPPGPYSIDFDIMQKLPDSNIVEVTVNGVLTQVHLDDGSFWFMERL